MAHGGAVTHRAGYGRVADASGTKQPGHKARYGGALALAKRAEMPFNNILNKTPSVHG
jgi:hypothetical protein